MNIILYFQAPVKRSDRSKLDGAYDIARRLGWVLQTIDLFPTAQRIEELTTFWKPLGIIVETDGWEAPIDPRLFTKTPTVFLDLPAEQRTRTRFSVCQNSFETGLFAGRELLVSGRDSFAYIPFHEPRHWCDERRKGLERALSLNGKRCAVFDYGKNPVGRANYRQMLLRFLQDQPLPCACLAANDETATIVCAIASLAGLRIPEDLSILGIDNDEQICEASRPSLSSVALDFRKGGELAALLLSAILRDGAKAIPVHHLTFGPTAIIRRQSTRLVRTEEDAKVLEALELIRREACNGLTAEAVMKTFPCSRPVVARRFKQATGHTILEEIHAVQLERVKTLLKDPHRQLKSISDFCGFKNPNSLRKFFLKETGMTMSAWRSNVLD